MNLRMSLLTGAMALALGLPAAAQTPELAPGMAASVTAGVNLRTGPGTEHSRVTVIPEGAAVVIEECGSGWCQVAYDGVDGYVYDDYLSTTVAATDEWMLQTTSQHELRAGPGFEEDLIGMVPAGVDIRVEQCMPGWCEVTYDGMTGYLEIAEATPEETAAALASPAVGEGMAQTTADLNLRAGPGMEHSPIGVIPAGASVEIHDCMPGRVWCEVSYGGMTGYASERFLDFAS